jgi:hypothetical protein
MTSSSEYQTPVSRTDTLGLRPRAARAGGGDEPAAGAPASGSSARPDASSWRMTRSGRNSSRCMRRIVRSRATSDCE